MCVNVWAGEGRGVGRCVWKVGAVNGSLPLRSQKSACVWRRCTQTHPPGASGDRRRLHRLSVNVRQVSKTILPLGVWICRLSCVSFSMNLKKIRKKRKMVSLEKVHRKPVYSDVFLFSDTSFYRFYFSVSVCMKNIMYLHT